MMQLRTQNSELKTQNSIKHLYTALDAHFTPEAHWWPITTPTSSFEVVVGTVLVQQTRWQAVEAAIARLHERGLMQPATLASCDPQQLAQLIRPCAFHSQKAPGLQAICRYLLEHYAGDMAPFLAQERSLVRAELLSLPRIGRESADTIMLYAGGHALFVVDAYARRLFARVGLFPDLDSMRVPYDLLQQRVETALAADTLPMPCWLARAGIARPAHLPQLSDAALLYWELHALIVEACIHHCQATQPRCDRPGRQHRFLDPRKCATPCQQCSACPISQGCAWYHRDPAAAP